MTLPFDDDQAPFFTVGQVATMLDVQPAYLRRLDVEAVVQPARSDGGQRRYSREEIALVQHVTTMADAGMTLSSIRRILVLEAEVAQLRHQIARLEDAPTSRR
ncbi:MAG: MerR family transcriptional regulator [Acidimicrobiales bacterium]